MQHCGPKHRTWLRVGQSCVSCYVLLQALISYLKGEVATVSQLDENVPLVPFEPPAKRQKVGGAWQLLVY
jgi:hypothetical protein